MPSWLPFELNFFDLDEPSPSHGSNLDFWILIYFYFLKKKNCGVMHPHKIPSLRWIPIFPLVFNTISDLISYARIRSLVYWLQLDIPKVRKTNELERISIRMLKLPHPHSSPCIIKNKEEDNGLNTCLDKGKWWRDMGSMKGTWRYCSRIGFGGMHKWENLQALSSFEIKAMRHQKNKLQVIPGENYTNDGDKTLVPRHAISSQKHLSPKRKRWW